MSNGKKVASAARRSSRRILRRRRRQHLEPLERRELFAAHIVGSTTSYPTIQAAVNAAAAGAVINVDAGTYDETVSIYQPLTIRGANAGVDARGTRGAESIVYATQTVFHVYGNDVTIDGFTIEGDDANITNLQGAGVLMAPSIHGTQVLNDIIQNNVTGIYVSNNSNTDQCLIQHNLIQNNFEAGNNWQLAVGENGSRGIYTDGTVSGGYLTNVLINANTISNQTNYSGGDEDEGIIALQALTAGKQFNITISNNYLGYESKAVLATNVTNLTVIGNTVTNTADQSSGPLRFEGDANTVNVQYNTVTGNSGPGVAVDSSGVSGDSSGFVVDDNNIYSNDGIGFITQASVYDGPIVAVGDWWGSTSGPGGDGPGTGQAVWANGTSGHGVIPSGLASGGTVTLSPWATALVNIAAIPVPAAASALTASPAAGGQLSLTWTAPMSTSIGQLIQRSTDGVNFTTVATVPALLNAYTDTGLVTGVTYTYRVVTFNYTGNGVASNTAAAIPPVYQPPVPANGITLTSTTGTTNTLQWNVPAYPYGIAGYTVYRNGTAVGTTATPSFIDTGLTPNTAYTYTITTTDTTGAVSAPSGPTVLVSGTSQFQDASFELDTNTNVYDPASPNWTFTGNSAVEYSGGAFGTTVVPNGSQFAVIQGYNGGTIGAISQTLTVNPAGSYTISFSAAERSGYTAQPVTVTVDGTLVGTFTPTSTTWATFTTAALSLTAGSHTVTFSGTKNSGDDDSFIDAVSLNAVAGTTITPLPAAGAFADPSFEQTTGAYVYDPVTANWTFTGTSALTFAGGTNFDVTTPPNGTQTADLQGVSGSTLGAVAQTVNVTAAGQYTISFAAEQGSAHGLEPVAVIVDGVTVATISPTTKTSFLTYTTPVFSLTAGAQKITFAATTSVGDNITYIDTVSLNHVSVTSTAVPAPAAPALVTANAASPTQVGLSWQAGSAVVTSYTVLRSVDDVNWTTVASALPATTTTYLDAGLAAGAKYYYSIVAADATGSTGSAAVSVTTLAAAATATPLSTLAWTSATSGFKTVQKNTSVQGNTLTLHGTTYASGLGTSAASVITYSLGGAYTAFSVDVGIDAEENSAGAVLASVDFQLLGDGKVLFDSGDLGINSPTVHIAVPVTGVQVLTLVATNGVAGIAYDHADWAGATLYANPPAAAAPTGLTAVAVGASSIGLTWSPPVSAVTGYAVDRSTDGINFTTVATGLGGSATSWTDTSALAAGTTYYYRIRATNSVGTSANSTVASVATLPYSPTSIPLTTLTWTSATAGYGTVQKNQSIAGNTLNLHGVTYPTGIGTHAASVITYNLAGQYNVFSSDVGIDYEENGVGVGSVDFQVMGDGKLLYDSGILSSASPTDHFSVNVTGVQTLTLLATNGIPNNIDYDHADWAGATLLVDAAAPAAPTSVTAVATGAGSVTLDWTAGSSNQTGFAIDRSTDGVNFTTIATSVAAGAASYVDTSLAASTTYSYRIRALAAAGASANSAVAAATTLGALAVATPISALNWTSATAGYGTVQKNLSIKDNTLTLHGVTYPTGLGTHAASVITYSLAGQYSVFSSDVGIDDEEIGVGSGSVDFQVIGDGKVLFDTGILTSSSPTEHLAVSVAGVQTLQLVATNGIAGSIDYDHADWAGAMLASTPTAPAAPTNLKATAVTASAVTLTWTAPATTVATYAIDRSTDGVNFTTISTTVAGTATKWTDPAMLMASTTYTYRIRAVNAAGASANSAVAAATTKAPQVATNLSTLAPTSATAGYGAVQYNQSISGNPLTVGGTVYASGIGTHAASTIVYNLAGNYSAFTSTVGIDQEEDGKGVGYVDFQVYGDGVLLFDSGVLTNDQTARIAVSVAGVKTLTLVVSSGIPNNIDYDHADWAGAQLLV